MTNDFQELYRCVLFVTNQPTSPVSVRLKPVDTCLVGIEKGNAAMLKHIVQALTTTFFAFKAEEDIQQVIWKKAIVNCVFNSVCTLLEADNGIFHRNRKALEIARTIIAECSAIARQTGMPIHAGDIEESLLKISKSSDGQIISTLQDICNKKMTEIETLNFEIIRIAESIHQEEKVVNTKLLGELMKLKAEASLCTL